MMIKSLLLSTAFLICSGLIVAEPSLSKPLRKYQVKGLFTIIKSYDNERFINTSGEDSFCFGYGGMDDLKFATPVTITDEQGKILAIGELEAGREDSDGCTMSFKIDNIPKASFYSVEVARRGKVTYSFDRMVESGWRVGLSVGKKY